MTYSINLVRFGLMFTVFTVGLAIISGVLKYFAGFAINGGLLHIVSAFSAAADAGQNFFKQHQQVPSNGFA